MLGGGIEMSRVALYKIAAVALLVGAVLSAAGNLLATGRCQVGGCQRNVLPGRRRSAPGRSADHDRLAGRLPALPRGERRPRLGRGAGAGPSGGGPLPGPAAG